MNQDKNQDTNKPRIPQKDTALHDHIKARITRKPNRIIKRSFIESAMCNHNIVMLLMGMLVIWGAIPLTTFVISLLIGANGYWGRKKWWAVPILALMYTLIPFLTFTLANAASTGISAGDIAMHLDDLITLPIGAAVSAVGLAIGTGIEKLRARKKRED